MASDALSSAAPGTKEIVTAKKIGVQIIESFWTDAGRAAEKLKLRNDHAKISELIERYQQHAAQRPATIRSNARSLRMIVQVVHSGDREIDISIDRRSHSRIREAATRASREASDAVDSRDSDTANAQLDGELPAPGPINRRASQDEILRGIEAARFNSVRCETVETPRRSLPRPLDMQSLSAIEAATPALAKRDPAVYVAH